MRLCQIADFPGIYHTDHSTCLVAPAHTDNLYLAAIFLLKFLLGRPD